ncbi:MAG: branched-chain amino acid ABC transporter permease [Burkholderiaceae bacterium]|nr:branched-chain amino acid ABC transporter permease [Burkholderiaceae bacterium]
MPNSTLKFKPINVGRWFIWGMTALLFLATPLIFNQGFSITLLSQMGTSIIFALSFNMLLGQTGMLSFGHAVYSGLGAFFTMHALNAVSAGKFWFPVTFLPLIGGLAGAFFGILFGYVTTKKSGTPFAMITLGIGEMVFASSLMFPGFFGGEGGITGNRVVGEPFLGISYGPAIQVYYLIAGWCFFCIVAMYAFTHTPLGRMANAVRDNPERVEFIGYNTQRVRWYVLIISSFFAGIAGGLTALNFEIVSAENVSAIRSGGVLLATFIGGALFFFGPIIGAIVFVFFSVALSEFTKAWQLYLGIFFVLMVLYAPGGISSLILMNLRVIRFAKFKRLLDPYLGVFIGALLLSLGIMMVIEMTYHLTLDASNGTVRKIFGFSFDTAGSTAWIIATSLLTAGLLVFEPMRRRFMQVWNTIQEEIEVEQTKKLMV